MSNPFHHLKTFYWLDMISTREFLAIFIFKLNSPFILASGMSHEDIKNPLFKKCNCKYPKLKKKNIKKASIRMVTYNCLVEGCF